MMDNNENINPSINCNEQIVELMKIYRHDWLNHLQVILGYVSLNKSDQIIAYVNKVHQEAKQRSIISNLKNVDIAAFLYMIPIHYPKINLELEIDEQLKLAQDEIDGNFLINTLKSFIEPFNLIYDEVGVGTLILAMVKTEQGLNITFEYEGQVIQTLKENIMYIGNKYNTNDVCFELIIADKEELVMELVFPLTEN